MAAEESEPAPAPKHLDVVDKIDRVAAMEGKPRCNFGKECKKNDCDRYHVTDEDWAQTAVQLGPPLCEKGYQCLKESCTSIHVESEKRQFVQAYIKSKIEKREKKKMCTFDADGKCEKDNCKYLHVSEAHFKEAVDAYNYTKQSYGSTPGPAQEPSFAAQPAAQPVAQPSPKYQPVPTTSAVGLIDLGSFVRVLWDIDNCSIPEGVDPVDLVDALHKELWACSNGKSEPEVRISVPKAKLTGRNAISRQTQEALDLKKVELILVVSLKANATADKIKELILEIEKDSITRRTTGTIVLVTGDKDFSTDVNRIRQGEARDLLKVIVIYRKPVNANLIKSASLSIEWDKVLQSAQGINAIVDNTPPIVDNTPPIVVNQKESEPAPADESSITVSSKLPGTGDALLRLNFLNQASVLMAGSEEESKEGPQSQRLSQFYGSVGHGVAQRVVMRVDSEAKRSICRKCKSPLIPGLTSRVRIKPRRERHVNVTCLVCGECRRFLAREDHALAYDAIPKTVFVPNQVEEPPSETVVDSKLD